MTTDDDDYSGLFDEDDHAPSLVRGDALELTALGGPDAELSTGLVLTWRNRLVFGIQSRANPLGARGQTNVAAFVGIGGHLEPGESWGAAAVREAQEEACCRVALADSVVTYLCREAVPPRPLAYRWREPHRPLLVWLATFNLRRGPQRERRPVNFVNAVFRAAALESPEPGAEMEALLLLDQDTLRFAYWQPRTFAELRRQGAEVIGTPPAPAAVLAPGGTAFFYAQWLDWQERDDTA
jgi:8-oxo-dGTP pyrophosphatase MutT (NUDIX family)